MKLDISDILADFPDTRMAAIVAGDLAIAPERPAGLDALIAEREAACRRDWADIPLAEIPGIGVWRRVYRAFGIKQTSYRSSVERLVKNVLAGRPLARINGFVDAYNMVSLSHVFPAGADDLDKVSGDLRLRQSRPGDSFRDMAPGGVDGVVEAPPKPGEVVYADAEKILCRRWNWRQDGRSLVTPDTRRAVVTVQSQGIGDHDAAIADLCAALERFCGARVAVAIADAGRPVVALPDA